LLSLNVYDVCRVNQRGKGEREKTRVATLEGC
jgi:hypothetical protein